jgi:hypothetical protein
VCSASDNERSAKVAAQSSIVQIVGKAGNPLAGFQTAAQELQNGVQTFFVLAEDLADMHAGGEILPGEAK